MSDYNIIDSNRKKMGYSAIDPSHCYILNSIDGYKLNTLTFVKRIGENFPNNTGKGYAGTTLQIVVRVLIDRINYLQKQKWCVENYLIICLLRSVIWLLEFRAARRHGILLIKSPKTVTDTTICSKCGHTVCEHR